ncbi:MAG: hypothetical protein KJ814_02900, partial [Proteobacteria bacterium]|nr:hypothetical protein [Pseudomonadota bacterium]
KWQTEKNKSQPILSREIVLLDTKEGVTHMEQSKPPDHQIVQRFFEQGPDSISIYSDLSQVVNTGHEIVFQFYETIPGAPGPDGAIQTVRSRLRATITVSIAHAKNFANNLLMQTQIDALKVEPQK